LEIESVARLKEAVDALVEASAGWSVDNRKLLQDHVSKLESLVQELIEDLSHIDVKGTSTAVGALAIALEAGPVSKKTSFLVVQYNGARLDSTDSFEYRKTMEIKDEGGSARVVRRGLRQGTWRVTVKTNDGWSASEDVDITAGKEVEVTFRHGDGVDEAAR
jgi:hypothetical protein